MYMGLDTDLSFLVYWMDATSNPLYSFYVS